MPSRVFTEGIGHTNETVSATVDSSGNLVMAKDIKLPAAGGIKDSSGNNLLTEAGSAVTLSDKVIPANSFMFRNKLINGNFDFWQRGTSQTSAGYGSADRWNNDHSGSSKTASQQAFTLGQTEVPGNPKYYLRHVVTSASGSGNYCLTQQKIEGVSTLAGKTATLSFWAKADSNKNIAIEIIQYFGTGGSPSSTVNGIGVTTYSLTTSWQKFTTTVSIPSISGKTLGTNGNDYLHLVIWFDSGSTYNSRNNSLGQQSGTFDIAQVQLEEGSSATPFEHRPAGMELSLCQRYFQVLGNSTNSAAPIIGTAFTIGTNEVMSTFSFITEMRSAPSITQIGDLYFRAQTTSVTLPVSKIASINTNKTAAHISYNTLTVSAGDSGYIRDNTGSNRLIQIVAEL